MRKLALLLAFGVSTLVWGSGAVTVQVISAVYEKSVTKEFDARLKKSGLEIHKKVENNRYIVTLGSFKDEHSAQNALKKARHIVAKDAFIRPVERHAVAVAPKEAHPKAVAHTDVKPTVHTAVTSEVKPSAAVKPTEAKPAAAPTAAAEAKTVVVAKPAETKPVAVTTAPSECDKREMHKDEFAEAIRYYKTSPYHRFEPVVLRQ